MAFPEHEPPANTGADDVSTSSTHAMHRALQPALLQPISVSPFGRQGKMPLTTVHKQSVNESEHRRRTNTIIGFGSAVAASALLVLLLTMLDITPYVRVPEQKTIPIQLLQLDALGETTGSNGNMSEEGAAAKGEISSEPLADAQPAPKIQVKPSERDVPVPKIVAKNAQTTAQTTTPQLQQQPTQTIREFTNQAFPRPTENIKTSPTSPNLTAAQSSLNPQNSPSGAAAKSPSEGSGSQSRLLADASGGFGVNEGSGGGLGRFGSGAGRGAGYGLEWGGGGNRVVLHKEMPKYPSGVNTSAQIRIRFTVLPNGSVAIIMPMQKGEPALERAAIEALRRWQFNPTGDDKEMIGFITFTFRVQ